MNYKRRDFLRLSGNFALGLAIAPAACKLMSKEEEEAAKVLSKYGLQLYTLRDDLPKDPKGVLQQVASFGYKQIEGYEGPQGLFWGMTNLEFKKYMDALGMEFISSHCDIDKDFEKKAAEAAAIGMKYLICPYKGAQKTLDDYKKIADDFNVKGEICKKNGIRFAYHNHDYTFKQLEGQLPQDVLMKGTDPALVDFEMDIYWVVTAGADPITWLNKYPGRFKLCHVKDRKKGAEPKDHDASIDLGIGSIDFKSILKAGSSKGLQYFIVEQERYDNSTPLKSAATDAVYMKKFKM